jgi:hypothetical protein
MEMWRYAPNLIAPTTKCISHIKNHEVKNACPGSLEFKLLAATTGLVDIQSKKLPTSSPIELRLMTNCLQLKCGALQNRTSCHGPETFEFSLQSV